MLLYIHIPFCDSKCSYCAFNSYVDKFSQRERYMKALSIQLDHELERFHVSNSNQIISVFIGGGTPSTVAPELYAPIFERFTPYLAENAEITSEANPNSATKEWLEGMKRLGVNRISFGVQSFNDTKLKTLGRAHHTEHAIRSIQTASELGYEHLSLDLIYGVRGDTKSLLQEDIVQAFSLPIDHISLYALTIEQDTAFESSPDMADEELDLTAWLFNEITSRGFDHYEISNFGRYRSRHNIGYWEHLPYMGVGAGAVGFMDSERFYPSTDIETYIADPLIQHIESLDNDALLSEKLFLGFRSCVGVDESILNKKQKQNAQELFHNNLLHYRHGYYFNPNFLLADEIALRVEGY